MILPPLGMAPKVGVGNDSNTVLLIRPDGANGSTAFVDASKGGAGSPRTITNVGTISVDTSQTAFSGYPGSVNFGTAAGAFTVASSADFAFGAGDFTFETNIRFSSIPAATNQHIIDTTGTPFVMFFTEGTGWRVGLNSVFFIFAWTPVINTWYHVATSRNGTNLRAFVDGAQIGTTQTSSDNIAAANMFIGETAAAVKEFNGWLQNLRISKVARYTAAFAKPLTPYL